MRKILFLFVLIPFISLSQEYTVFLPEVAWRTIVDSVVYQSTDTFTVKVNPLDLNDIGAFDKTVGNFLFDNKQRGYKIINNSILPDGILITVVDVFKSGAAPFQGLSGFVVETPDGSFPSGLGTFYGERLDPTNSDYRNAIDLRIAYEKGQTIPFDSTRLYTGYIPTGTEPEGTSYWDSSDSTVKTVLKNREIYEWGKLQGLINVANKEADSTGQTIFWDGDSSYFDVGFLGINSIEHLRDTLESHLGSINANTQAIKDTASQIRADIPDIPDISGFATKIALSDSTAQVRSEIPDVSGFLTSETDPVAIDSINNNLRPDINQNTTDISTNQQAIIDSSASLQGQIDGLGLQEITDFDKDSTNEIQRLYSVSNRLYLSNSPSFVQFDVVNPINLSYSTNKITINHSTNAGYKHIPSGGADGNVLYYGGSSGTALWGQDFNLWNNTADSIPELRTDINQNTNSLAVAWDSIAANRQYIINNYDSLGEHRIDITQNYLNTLELQDTTVGLRSDINYLLGNIYTSLDWANDFAAASLEDIGTANAVDVSISDAGDYFTGTNVEDALQEAGQQITLNTSDIAGNMQLIQNWGLDSVLHVSNTSTLGQTNGVSTSTAVENKILAGTYAIQKFQTSGATFSAGTQANKYRITNNSNNQNVISIDNDATVTLSIGGGSNNSTFEGKVGIGSGLNRYALPHQLYVTGTVGITSDVTMSAGATVADAPVNPTDVLRLKDIDGSGTLLDADFNSYALNGSSLLLDTHKSGSLGALGQFYMGQGSATTPTWVNQSSINVSGFTNDAGYKTTGIDSLYDQKSGQWVTDTIPKVLIDTLPTDINTTNFEEFIANHSGNETITLSGEVTGSGTTSISTTVTDNVIDYANVDETLKDTIVDNDVSWDMSAHGIIYSSVSGAIGTMAISNAQVNKTICVVMTISSFTSLTVPANIIKLAGSADFADGTFYLYIHCIGTNLFTMSVTQAAT